MRNWLWAYIAAGLAMLALDFIWLTVTADRLYRPNIGHLMAGQFNLAPAIVFYLIYVAGILVLAVAPSLAGGDWRAVALRGAALGFVAFATYDLTNQSVLRDWPWIVSLADIAWGTFLTTIAATCGFLAMQLHR